MATRIFLSSPGSFIRYTVRHSHQARKPEIFRPKTSATAEWCPSDPILPSALNENARLGRPRRLATMFSATQRASRVACWAVGGAGSLLFASVMKAQSPAAHTRG